MNVQEARKGSGFYSATAETTAKAMGVNGLDEASNHAGQRVTDKADRTSVGLFATGATSAR